MVNKKLLIVLLYFLYMLALVFMPLEPSLYNVFIDTIEYGTTQILCFILYKYHDSIPMSHKTMLNFLMKVLAASYGSISIFYWLTYLLFNIFPLDGVKLLHSYPSTICFILSGDIFSVIFFINLFLIIVLHSCFSAHPTLFLDMNEAYLKAFIYSFNIGSSAFLLTTKWSQSFCGKSLIHRVSQKLNLNITEDSLVMYQEGSWFTASLGLFAVSAVLYSKLRNVIKRKVKPSTSVGANHVDILSVYLLTALLCCIIFVRLIMNLELKEEHKQIVSTLYNWTNTVISRLIGSSVPLYWLIRKEDSRLFVKRKLQHIFLKYTGTTS